MRHPLYPVFAQQRIDKLALESMAPMEKWRRVKQALRAAGAATRNAALVAQPTSPKACAQRAMQLVRALHRDDASQVHMLCRRWAALHDYIESSEHSFEVRDTAQLARFIRDSILAGAPADDAPPPDRAPHRLQTSGNYKRDRSAAWLRLWLPHAQRRWLAGVTTDPTSSAPSRSTAEALAQHWAATFKPVAVDQRLSLAMARIFVAPDSHDRWPTPSAKQLSRAKPSAPGPSVGLRRPESVVGAVRHDNCHRVGHTRAEQLGLLAVRLPSQGGVARGPA